MRLSCGPATSGDDRQEQYARKLEAIFGAIDEEGDGEITEERLVEALERPLVPGLQSVPRLADESIELSLGNHGENPH